MVYSFLSSILGICPLIKSKLMVIDNSQYQRKDKLTVIGKTLSHQKLAFVIFGPHQKHS